MAASDSRSSARVAPRSVSWLSPTSVITSCTVLADGQYGGGAGHVPDGAVADGAHLDHLSVAQAA